MMDFDIWLFYILGTLDHPFFENDLKPIILCYNWNYLLWICLFPVYFEFNRVIAATTANGRVLLILDILCVL